MENTTGTIKQITVYCIPGLGADRRAYSRLQLPPGFAAEVLEWEEALPHESFEGYAQRFARKINMAHPFVLLGHSMGGMIASEIAPLVRPLKTILISSASHGGEVPPYYHWSHALRLPYIIPPRLFKVPNPAMHWALGAHSPEVKRTNDSMMRSFSPAFFTWAFRRIPAWKRTARPPGIIHLHGTADRILPIRFVRPDIRISAGGHLMLLEQAGEVNSLIQKTLLS